MKESEPIVLVVRTSQVICSFKNSKRSILDGNTGLQRTLTPKKTKLRMQELEDGILFALYSLCQTAQGETGLACLKQLRTALCEQLKDLSDDSLNQIPEFSFGVKYTNDGTSGVEIYIDAFTANGNVIQ